MKVPRWIIVAAGIAFALPAQAQDQASRPDALNSIAADIGGTELILYRFPGVRNDDANVVTVFHCTNFSGVAETLRAVVRDAVGVGLANSAFTINHLQTLSLSTNFNFGATLNTGPFSGGSAAIAATSTSIVCTALITGSSGPTAALHGIRFNPAPASQE